MDSAARMTVSVPATTEFLARWIYIGRQPACSAMICAWVAVHPTNGSSPEPRANGPLEGQIDNSFVYHCIKADSVYRHAIFQFVCLMYRQYY